MSVMDSIEDAYQEKIAALEAAVKEKDEVIENWKREHNRLIDVDCEKILALNADNEILRNMNKILLDSGGALTAERDGYRNGQAQVQSIADGLMDTVEKYAKERIVLTADKRELEIALEVEHDQGESFFVQLEALAEEVKVLTAENAELTKICLAGEPPYYTKWKEVTAELESSNRKLENVCAVLEKKNSHIDTLTAENQWLRKEMINLYNCRYEPDKMLCLVERWKQALKQTVSPEEPDAAWKLGLKLHQNEQTEGGGRC
jgi:hypothetical protein